MAPRVWPYTTTTTSLVLYYSFRDAYVSVYIFRLLVAELRLNSGVLVGQGFLDELVETEAVQLLAS